MASTDNDQNEADLEVATLLAASSAAELSAQSRPAESALSDSMALSRTSNFMMTSKSQSAQLYSVTPGSDTFTSVHQMAAQGELGRLQEALQQDPELVNKPDNYTLSPLMWACANNQHSTVTYLLTCGSEVNTTGMDGETALMLASSGGHTSIIQDLLTAGANINAANKNGNSSLHFSVYKNHQGASQLLLKRGADLTLTNNLGMTPFDLAAQLHLTKMQQVLEQHLVSLFTT